MKGKYFSVAVSAAAGLTLGVVVDGFRTPSSGAADKVDEDEVQPAPTATEGNKVVLNEELAKRAKITTAPIDKQALHPTLRLVGSVNFDADEVADVGARIESRVARMMVTVGDEVKAGQTLVEIDSNEIGGALAALLSARANLIAAEITEKRETDLAKQQLSTSAVVERSRAEARALRAELNGATQRLLAMGFTADELARIEAGHPGARKITLRAPIDGEVVKRNAVLGQVVGPTQPILQIADLDHLWVELDVFERDLGHVADGDAAEIESESHPGKVFRGRVTHVAATVDLNTRTAHVRVEVENPERLLRPGQFVHARLSTVGDTRPVLGVPRSAVLQVEGETTVFVAEGNNTYTARPVELGVAAGDWVEITRGLVEGDVVVTAGAFVLKSELLR
ncbi:MAG TPA: efflux RND transporter periplasmic adaptor subunit [Polyangiales bacterium]|nr:efflux RND transporter periplasmic adaptor subunit [Polyangiales bacterium]